MIFNYGDIVKKENKFYILGDADVYTGCKIGFHEITEDEIKKILKENQNMKVIEL
ncbi:MAG: hypothetical protein IKP65_00190 [Alphaproteobacteria bacterium]|nr:hypothetical protein [Alphaproteobacteria bacterium]